VDHDLIVSLLSYIDSSSYGDGAVLIFLPGWHDISVLGQMLDSTSPFSNTSKFRIMQLHGGIPTNEQKMVFSKMPKGVRKIVLATNIAETSITIDDVAFVIDSGKAKEKGYDPHLGTSTLTTEWISQASVRQRQGRAGRTKAGVAFHLMSKRRHASLRPFLDSELLRTPLEELCLLAKRLGLANGGYDDFDGIPALMNKAIDAPHPLALKNAVGLLVEIGAMDDETNALTDLGWKLSGLSVAPRLGKALMFGMLFGVGRSAAAIAVATSTKDPFVLPRKHQRCGERSDGERSDGERSESQRGLCW
jgi:ATP-dependent RNA helicase DHX36